MNTQMAWSGNPSPAVSKRLIENALQSLFAAIDAASEQSAPQPIEKPSKVISVGAYQAEVVKCESGWEVHISALCSDTLLEVANYRTRHEAMKGAMNMLNILAEND